MMDCVPVLLKAAGKTREECEANQVLPNKRWQRTVDAGVASPLPFGGVPLHHPLSFNRVARPAARGVRRDKPMLSLLSSWPKRR